MGQGFFSEAGNFHERRSRISMAQIAIDYYKDGPSLLPRYLPFWMAIYARRTIALLIATLAIVLPVFGFAPRLYGWFVQERLRKLYRRLRVIEKAMQVGLTVPKQKLSKVICWTLIGWRVLFQCGTPTSISFLDTTLIRRVRVSPPVSLKRRSGSQSRLRRERINSSVKLFGQCPLWVKSGHLQRKRSCPLYPPKADIAGRGLFGTA